MTKKTPKPPKKLDDKDLWGHVTAGVDRLDQRHKNVITENLSSTASGPVAKKGKTPAPPPQPPTPENKRPKLQELDHGSSVGIDKSTATRLKKGKQPIEARLDLHGKTQNEAHPALDTFIESAYRSGRRCVLVITGKGTKPDGSVGVLRSAVPRWLNLPPNRARILAFSHATAKDGGEGALYVMIKRRR
ncbi:MAG TPA: hypothetical protein ENI69_08805 [Rhodospirillales bacterium]|nr:hypothetical protein [Rhodospirillales bacterium]